MNNISWYVYRGRIKPHIIYVEYHNVGGTYTFRLDVDGHLRLLDPFIASRTRVQIGYVQSLEMEGKKETAQLIKHCEQLFTLYKLTGRRTMSVDLNLRRRILELRVR